MVIIGGLVMDEKQTILEKIKDVTEKYSQVDAAGQTYIPVEDQEAFQKEINPLQSEFFQLLGADQFYGLGNDVKKQVMRNTIQSVIESEEVPKEPIKYNEIKVQEEKQKIFDQIYRIEVEVLDGGQLPCKAHKTDAGFDLFATEDVEISFGQGIKHPLNIKMKLPEGAYAQIETKSGLGSRGMLVYAGVIDETYRGIPHVVAAHIRSDLPPIKIKKGQKIAQMTMRPHSNNFYTAEADEVPENTDRGTGGFGSSGA